MVLAPQLLALFGYHGSLGVGLARVIFPTVVMLGLNGLQTAILNALDEFFLPAIAPVAWNIVIVGTLALSLPFLHTTDERLYAYAIGILLGTAVQLAIPYPAMRRLGHLSWFCDPRDEAVQRVFALMLPVTLGLGLINLNLLVNTWFAARVDPRPRPGRRRQGVPHLHAAAGHVLGRRGRRALPGALAARGRARRAGLPRARRLRACARSRSC